MSLNSIRFIHTFLVTSLNNLRKNSDGDGGEDSKLHIKICLLKWRFGIFLLVMGNHGAEA